MKRPLIILLGLITALTAVAEDLDFSDISRIVIQASGRQKPLDTFASESLQLITGRRTVTDPATGGRLGATDALLSIWFGKRDWANTPIVLISDPDIRNDLNLPRERHFSFADLMANPRMAEYFHTISNKSIANEDLTPLEKEAQVVLHRMDVLNLILSGEGMTIVPNPSGPEARWTTLLGAIEYYDPQTATGLIQQLKRVTDSYLADDGQLFATASSELRQQLRGLAPEHYLTSAAVSREVHYNTLHPFRLAWILYLIAFFLLLAKPTYKIGLALFSAGLAFNIYGFVLRAWIAERAPVTNMYETVVWTALALALFAIIFEAIYRSRIYALCAAPLAILALILADMFPTVLDPSINPLPPVLRDNFWLVTHVVTIMLGYAAFALAFGIGHYILGKYLFKPGSIDEESEDHHLLYRVLQLGILFLALGTILGGVWANYSWGRFWGWDPKETWALIALLLYIFGTHGKIAGWWGNFGMAVAACLCFNGILMAWFGVNFVLGAGLHSYGFGTGGAEWVGLVVAIDVTFVAICGSAHLRRQRGLTFLNDSAAAGS